MSEPIFINHEIVFNPTGNEFDECRGELLGSYQLVKIEDYEYKFIKQPHLTIPKSIADSIQIGKSKLTPALAIRWKGSLYNLTTGNIKLSKESLNWVLNGKSKEECEERNLVLFAYLNPLTRDLVKVVEG